MTISDDEVILDLQSTRGFGVPLLLSRGARNRQWAFCAFRSVFFFFTRTWVGIHCLSAIIVCQLPGS